MEDKYTELRAALDAFKPGNGDAMLAYRLASDPATIRALLAERDALRVALEDELTWHEAQDKAISKQPDANTGHTWWRRMQHQEHAIVIRAALAQEQGEKHDNKD